MNEIQHLKLLPPPVPERWQLIADARRRRIPASAIATGLCISRQRVFQLIENYERARGPIYRHDSDLHTFRGRKIFFRCLNCGASCWEASKLFGRKFCSVACHAYFERLLDEEEIKMCIDSRLTGATWKGLSQLLNTSYNTVQHSIWMWLHNNGRLSHDELERIWRPHGGYARWQWLINHTGLVPR